MSYRSTIHEKTITLAAGERRELEIGLADFLFFHLFPAGLTASINDLAPVAVPEGFLDKGPPGEGNFRALTLLNPTAGPLTARLLYGLGDITVAGAVALIGSVPLPSGASTLAEQATQTARLTALTAANIDTPQFLNQGASAVTTYSNCKSFSVLNTGAGNITLITPNGVSGALPAGYGVDFPISKPFNLLGPITVATGAGGAALIALTL